jgi:hypothetical protein
MIVFAAPCVCSSPTSCTPAPSKSFGPSPSRSSTTRSHQGVARGEDLGRGHPGRPLHGGDGRGIDKARSSTSSCAREPSSTRSTCAPRAGAASTSPTAREERRRGRRAGLRALLASTGASRTRWRRSVTASGSAPSSAGPKGSTARRSASRASARSGARSARGQRVRLHPVIAWSRSLTPAKANELGVGYAASLEDLAARSQHPVAPSARSPTRPRKIVGARSSARCPRGPSSSTRRAPPGRLHGAREAVKKKLRVALDVFPDEPKGTRRVPEADLFAPGARAEAGFVYGTPHIAASTDQAQLAIATETVRVIRSFLLEGTCRTWSTCRRRRSRASSSSFAWSTRWGRSRTCSTSSSGTASTSKR